MGAEKGGNIIRTIVHFGNTYTITNNMELSERWLQTFEEEGFASVYEWQDQAGTTFPPHAHQGKVALFVTDGSITFDLNGEKKEVVAGQRFDVPVGVEHSATVGPNGWIVIVGEEIDGDS